MSHFMLILVVDQFHLNCGRTPIIKSLFVFTDFCARHLNRREASHFCLKAIWIGGRWAIMPILHFPTQTGFQWIWFSESQMVNQFILIWVQSVSSESLNQKNRPIGIQQKNFLFNVNQNSLIKLERSASGLRLKNMFY